MDWIALGWVGLGWVGLGWFGFIGEAVAFILAMASPIPTRLPYHIGNPVDDNRIPWPFPTAPLGANQRGLNYEDDARLLLIAVE